MTTPEQSSDEASQVAPPDGQWVRARNRVIELNKSDVSVKALKVARGQIRVVLRIWNGIYHPKTGPSQAAYRKMKS